MRTLYAGDKGTVITIKLEEDGVPIPLSNCTATLYIYSFGTDAIFTTQPLTISNPNAGICTYTTSGELNTPGYFYSIVGLVYTNGNTKKVAGPSFEIISGQENIVSVEEFRKFIDVPQENSKPDSVIKSYLEDGETIVNKEMPALAKSKNPDDIKMKQMLVKLRAGILYFMNSDEQFIDPNKRIAKIELWESQYNSYKDKFNAALSSSADGNGVVRRVKNSSYSKNGEVQ